MISTIIYPQELSSLIESTIEANKDKIFKPTYLYIKQHSDTGKLYFGKTDRSYKSMITYLGSGVYWSDHLNIHGKDVETIWFCLFTDLEQLVEFALSYCYLHNIGFGDTSVWANLVPETGCGTQGMLGRKHSDETNINKANHQKVNQNLKNIKRILVYLN
jgi:hypothetical protein